MPRTRRLLEKKYPNYNNKVTFYQMSKFRTQAGNFFLNYLGEERTNQILEVETKIQDSVDRFHSDDRIEGIDLSNSLIPDDMVVFAKKAFKEWDADIKSAQDRATGKYSDFEKDDIYVANPENGDMIRAILDNPSLQQLVKHYGAGFTVYDRKGEMNNPDLEKALLDHFHGLRRIVELQYQRQKDLDNFQGKRNEEKFQEDYYNALNDFINNYDKLVSLHENLMDQNGDVPEFTDVLQNELSEITDVSLKKMRGHNRAAVDGLRYQIKALENGWKADELAIMSFIGSTKGEIDLQRRLLNQMRAEYELLEPGEKRTDLENKYNALKQQVDDFENDFNVLHDEVANAEVHNDRLLKVQLTKKVVDFTNKYKGHVCLYDYTGEKKKVYIPSFAADNILDPYGMKGLSRPDQLKDIMDDLNEVDGTFQKSSTNFKALRTCLEELEKFAKEHPGKLTDEEADKYIELVKAAKDAAKTYRLGKQDEARQYKRANGRSIEWADITKKRMGFAAELDYRLDCHLENALDNRPYVSMDKTEHSIARFAYLLRKEERIKAAAISQKGEVVADDAFMESVYRSIALEAKYAQLRNGEFMDAEKFEGLLDEDNIDRLAFEIKHEYRNTGHEKLIIDDINHRIKLGETKFDRTYIYQVKKTEPLEDYPDRDETTGVSQIEELEHEYGIAQENIIYDLARQKRNEKPNVVKTDEDLLYPENGYLKKVRAYMASEIEGKGEFNAEGIIKLNQNAPAENPLFNELVADYNAIMNLELQRLAKDRFGWQEGEENAFLQDYAKALSNMEDKFNAYEEDKVSKGLKVSALYKNTKNALSARNMQLEGVQSVREVFKEKAELPDPNQILLSDIPDGELSDEQLHEYVRQYVTNLFNKVSGDEMAQENVQKYNFMDKAMKSLADDMNLSGMTGKELKEFLTETSKETENKTNTFLDWIKMADAYYTVNWPGEIATDEMKELAKEYEQIVSDRKERQESEEAEKRFLAQEGLVDFKPREILTSDKNAMDYLTEMMAKEADLRVTLIHGRKQAIEKGNDEVKAYEDKILFSVCRSIYMEMLRNRYEVKGGMDDAALEANEKKFRIAISHGFRDNENIQAFTDLMNKGKFGEHFKEAIHVLIEKNNGVIEHKDALKARDYALFKAYSDYMPDPVMVKDENGNSRVSENSPKPNFEKASNIISLAEAFGSKALDFTEGIRMPIDKNSPDLKDVNIAVEYKTRAEMKQEPPKAPTL